MHLCAGCIFPVSARRNAVMLFEQAVEAFFIFISQMAADVGDFGVRGKQHVLCLAQADIFQQVFEIPSGLTFDQPGAVSGGKVEMFCQLVQGDGLVVVINIGNDILQVGIRIFVFHGITGSFPVFAHQLCEKNAEQIVDDPVRILIVRHLFQHHG